MGPLFTIVFLAAFTFFAGVVAPTERSRRWCQGGFVGLAIAVLVLATD